MAVPATIAEPAVAVSTMAGTATGKPVTSALSRLRPGSRGQPAGHAQLAHRDPGGHDRGGDVAQREVGGLEDRPGEMRPPVTEGQPDEGSPGGRVPDR